MPVRYLALFLIVALATAVFASTARPSVSQEAPPRPHRSFEDIPQWPETAVNHNDPEIDEGILPEFTPFEWGSRVWQTFQVNRWQIAYLPYGQSYSQIIGSETGANIQPHLNRGSTQVVFSSNRDGAYEIYHMPVSGSPVTRLTFSGSNNVNPAWSPNGNKIAFESYRDGQAEIYVMNADGSGQTRLTNNSGFDGMPTWSPDGSKIAFSSYRNGSYSIYVMNVNGSGVVKRSNQPYSFNPNWSPDGSKIAYDADLDGDGFQELWVMNADGSNQRLLVNPSGQTDAWAGSWTPDGNSITYTHINFVFQQGIWYWSSADLFFYSVSGNYTYRMTYTGREWHPDWQTADITPPVTTVRPLGAQSIHYFYISWTGQDVGPARIAGYDLRYKIGADGVWQTLINNQLGEGHEYRDAIGGQTYYFQVRARDYAGNVEAWKANNIVSTTIEGQPPQTTVIPLDPLTRRPNDGNLALHWTGFDLGGSGVALYELQYRLDDGPWMSWTEQTGGPATFYNLEAGRSYGFRVRGIDHAQNQENWNATTGETSTMVYSALIRGVAQDNSGTPVQGLDLITNPAAFMSENGDANGRYTALLATLLPTYNVTWAKSGYGPLPTTTFSTAQDVDLPIVLPPADNALSNSGFESGAFAPGWLPGGSTAPTITNTTRHTGQFAALLSQGGEGFDNGRILGNSSDHLQIVVDNAQTVHAAWIYNDQLVYHHRVAGVWQPAQIITNLTYGMLQLAVDDANTAHLAWQSSAGIYYARRPANGNWSTPELVAGSGQYQPELHMGVTGSGIVHLIWQPGSNRDIFYRQRTSSGTWTAVQNISNNNINNSSFGQSMFVDSGGAVHVAWTAGLEVFYTSRPAGGSWSAPLNISQQPNMFSGYPSLAAEADGVVHAVWGCSAKLCYARRAINGVWSSPYAFVESGNLLTRLTLDEDRNLHIIYGPEYDERVIRRDTSGNWSPALELRFNGQTLRSIVDSSGLVHAVYQDANDTNAYYTRQIAGGGWTLPTLLQRDPQTDTFFLLQIALDNADQPHLLWRNAYARTYYAGPVWSTTADTILLTQPVTIPITMSAPTLSFLYQMDSAECAAVSCLKAAVDDGLATTTLWSPAASSPTWRHQALDLSAWAGQAISLTFRLEQAANAPLVWAYLDEVTLGAAHPDVWVTADFRSGWLNEQVTHTLTYGNQGGAIATGTRLTYTLPAELSFVSASQPPISTDPLVWELGDLVARSGPFNLSVVMAVGATAVPFSTLHSPVAIQPSNAELETLNNNAQSGTFIGHLVFLPMMNR
jgi:uncharacterized repeat protein (TIGR01451 family)